MNITEIEESPRRLEVNHGPEGTRSSGRQASAAATGPTKGQPNRRRLLRDAGALVAVAAVGRGVLASPAQAAPPGQTESPPAMRSPRPTATGRTATKPETPPLAVIALNRMAFGPRPGDLAAFEALGATDLERLQNYVAQQLAPESIDDSACDAVIAAYNFDTLAKSQEALWQDHVKSEEARDWQHRRQPAWQTERATFLRALHSRRQLQEVLADFWHNHFNVYAWDNYIQSTFVHYDRDVIRGHMLGNFRQMLGAVARSPAMLFYLDNQSNSGGNPNENYARELFELHGMGAENYLGVRAANDPDLVDEDGERIGYIDSDVYGATTCFTGWRIDSETGLFKFDTNAHFPYQKFVMGQILPEFMGEADGDTVLDLIADHPGTARYIARKLCRRLISDAPPEAIVQQAADVFYQQRTAPDQLKQVVEAILLSEAFRTSWGDKIKRPFEFVVSLVRATELDFDATSDSFFWWYNNLGQSLFGWHPPDGYPDVQVAWTGTMAILQRWRLVNSLLDWKMGGDGENKDDLRVQLDGIMPNDVVRPTAIVDFWSQRLLGYTLPALERNQIVEFMAYGRGSEHDLPADQIAERLRYMIGLLLMAPSFQWR